MRNVTPTKYSRRQFDLKAYDEVFADYPDPAKYKEFRECLEKGWRIGLKRDYPPRLKTHNNFSEEQLPLVAKEVLKWHKAGYIFGPISIQEAKDEQFTVNHFFAVPKGNNKVRPILNLSDKSVIGTSINDHLYEDVCTVEYVQQLEIIETLRALGPNAWLWAKDLKWGYNNVPIREADVRYLCFYFDGQIYCYQVLPMGLASSPKIFTEFMSFCIWAAKHQKPPLHYIVTNDTVINPQNFGQSADITEYDPFIVKNASNKTRNGVNDKNAFNKTKNDPAKDKNVSPEEVITYYKLAITLIYLDDILGGHKTLALANAQYDHVETVLNKLQLQSQPNKARPPAQIQVWLGKEYNTVKQWVKLTEDKLNKYVSAMNSFLKQDHATQREFLTHIGRARHMGTIYKTLNAFARGLERWAYSVPGLEDFIHISEAVKRDFEFTIWAMKLAHTEGASFSSFLKPRAGSRSFDVTIYTDASKTVGVGGISSTGDYFQQKWTDIGLSDPTKRDIQWRELCAVFMAIHSLQTKLTRKFVHIYTDNDAVKWMLIKMRSRLARPDLQILINKICEILLEQHIEIWMDHIPGEDNKCADALSRYFESPLETAPFSVHNRCDASGSLQLASDLASQTNVKEKFLSKEDDDL